MVEYFNDNTAASLELLILSGGTTVTGKTPVALIRDKDTGNYFDFASRTFTSTTVSATAVLTSSIDGLYLYTWDISGLFSSDSGSHLTFEYHDSTAASITDVLVTPKARVNVVGGGGFPGGDTVVQGVWTAKQKKKLFDKLDEINKNLLEFRSKSIELIRELLGRKTLKKEDLEVITQIRERDFKMFQELLKILDLKNDVSEAAVFERLQEYIEREERAKAEVIEKLEKFLDKKENLVNIDDLEEDDDDA